MEFWRGLGNLLTGGAIDRSEAKDTIESANWFMERAKESLEAVRKDTETSLADYGTLKLKVAAGSLKEFEMLFSKLEKFKKKQIKAHGKTGLRNLPNIDIAGIRQISISTNEILGAAGAGVVGGAAACVGAMGLAGLIGTASTGTAIGVLSGAAATNATLAWLGGGALSAGGAGMAGGMMVLGGIALAPFALILGGIGAYKAQQQLNEAENYYNRVMVEVEKMKTLEVELGQIRRGAELLSDLVGTLSILLEDLNKNLARMVESKKAKARKVIHNNEEDTQLMNNFNTADLLFKILNTPLMGEDGAFLSEPISKLENNGARDIIGNTGSEENKMKVIGKLKFHFDMHEYNKRLEQRKKLNPLVRFFANIFKPIRKPEDFYKEANDV